MKIYTKQITRQYFRPGKATNVFTAVKETDFTLEEGKLTEITGRSGSGKSTFLNMLSGLLKPTTGNVIYGEEDIYAKEDEDLSKFRNRHIGVIPQGQTGLSSLTVLQNVMLPVWMYEDTVPEEDALNLLRKVGIEELKDAYPTELSGGELRRMSIARALIRKPDVIFADEPTGDLDDENTKIVLSLLKEIAAEGRSVLLVTHEKEAADYADIIYEMKDGNLKRMSE